MEENEVATITQHGEAVTAIVADYEYIHEALPELSEDQVMSVLSLLLDSARAFGIRLWTGE